MWRIFAFVMALVMAGATPARAEWRRAESPNFVLYGNLSEGNLRTRILLLEDFDRLLRSLTAGEEPPAAAKLHVYILAGPAELRQVRDVPPGIAGFYTGADYGVAVFIDGTEAARGQNILLHEYAHHFMRQNTVNAYPAWYVEGFAEYFATVSFSERRIDIGRFDPGRARVLLEGRWLPMERLLAGGIEGLDRDGLAAFYAQSWLLVHYFYSTPERSAALARLLPALRRAAPAEALQAATGLTPQGLTDELRRYIRGGTIQYRQMARASAESTTPVTITMLPPSAAGMLLFAGRLRVGIDDEAQGAFLAQIRTAAARYPDDPLAVRTLAEAEALYGDGAAADRLLDRLLAAAPNDGELLYFKGMRYRALANSDNPPDDADATARLWFGRARAANPNHFQTLLRLAEMRRGTEDYRSQDTIDMLLRAHQLAPQVLSITMNAASLLISRRRYDEAITLLAPVALSPHDGGAAQAARAMIGRARTAMARGASGEPEE
jgi:hypothetical protein